MKFFKINIYKRVPASLAVALAVSSGSLTAISHAASVEDTHASEGEISANSGERASVPIVFRDGTTHMRVLDNVDGVAIAEGDIIFGDAQQYFNRDTLKRSARGLSNSVYGTVWPNGIVPYHISDDLSDSTEAKIRSAIARWNDTGAISLIERTAATESAYPNYVDFVDAEQCASWVGFQNNGGQSIYAGERCSEGSMIHEIGHALGLLHEHTRPDRDSYVQINWNSINVEKEHNFDILDDAITLGEYDYDSIMHYGSHFFSNNGTPTITPLQGSVSDIGQREYISEGDRNGMIELYQSEYSLVSSSSMSALVGSTIQLDMFVTNNSTVGANTMRIDVSVPAGISLVSFSSPSWVCQQSGEGSDVVCMSPALSQNDSTTVSMSLSTPATEGEVSFDTTLSANTHDTNKSNNQDSTSTVIVATGDTLAEEQKVTAQPPAQPQLQPDPVMAAATPTPSMSATPAAVAEAVIPTAMPTPVAAPAPAPITTPAVAAANAASTGGGSFATLGLLLLLVRRRVR